MTALTIEDNESNKTDQTKFVFKFFVLVEEEIYTITSLASENNELASVHNPIEVKQVLKLS